MARDIQMLQALVDEGDEDSYFRFLVGGRSIKYITIANGLYTAYDMVFAPTLIPLLPAFPPGEWNDGRISKNLQDRQPYFERVEKRSLSGVTSIWHPTTIDYLDLKLGHKLRSQVYEATCSTFPSTVVVKFANYEWEVNDIDHETTAYQWIEGRGIGASFLGHITESGRVIGFIIEKVANASRAGPEDLSLCQNILSRLHGLGIKHGDVNRHNFLVHDGRATLIDFDFSRKCQERSELHREMSSLHDQLSDTSGRGGSIRVNG